MDLILFLSVFISFLPFPILALFYELIPGQIPLFVDLAGNPTVMASKSILSVFRLPIMGLMIQLLCIAMYLAEFQDKRKIKTNKSIWITISIIGVIKMSLTSLEVLIYENEHLLNIFRILVLIAVIAGVTILIFHLFTLYRRQKSEFLKEYYQALKKWQSITMAIALTVYILMVFLPAIIQQ